MQNGVDDFDRRNTQLRMLVYRHSSSIVFDHDGVVLLDGNVNRLAVAGECFVDTVVHDLVDQMMQTFGTGTADVHTGPFADGFQSL